MKNLYLCKHCNNLIVALNDNVQLSCCGEKMQHLKPNTFDGAVEKHMPVYDLKDQILNVVVGEVEHPMTNEHYIQFIVVETCCGLVIKELKPEQKPCAKFMLKPDEKVLGVYAYCNLHGFWKK